MPPRPAKRRRLTQKVVSSSDDEQPTTTTADIRVWAFRDNLDGRMGGSRRNATVEEEIAPAMTQTPGVQETPQLDGPDEFVQVPASRLSKTRKKANDSVCVSRLHLDRFLLT